MTDKIKTVQIVQIKEDNLPSILKLLNGNKYIKQIKWGNDNELEIFAITLDIEIVKGKEISVVIYNNKYLVVRENGKINIITFLYDLEHRATYDIV